MVVYVVCFLDESGSVGSISTTTASGKRDLLVKQGGVEVSRNLNPNTEYVVDGEIRPRPTMEGFDRTAIEVGKGERAILRGVSAEARFRVYDGNDKPLCPWMYVEDGAIEVGSSVPKKMFVIVEDPPYREYRETLEAR